MQGFRQGDGKILGIANERFFLSVEMAGDARFEVNLPVKRFVALRAVSVFTQ